MLSPNDVKDVFGTLTSAVRDIGQVMFVLKAAGETDLEKQLNEALDIVCNVRAQSAYRIVQS